MADSKKVALVEVEMPWASQHSGVSGDSVERKVSSSFGTIVDIPDLNEQKAGSRETVDDEFDGAVKMAFIGVGQGGGRIAQAFWDIGYRKVCAVNTTEQDLVALEIPNKLVVGKDRGGAGKDPDQGRAAVKESYEEVMDLLMRSWGDDVQQMFVTVGAGGGSGTGGWGIVTDMLREYAKSTNVEKPIDKKIGVIMTLPKRSEGSRVQQNAWKAIKLACDMAEAGDISPLILIDNAKIHELFPKLPVKSFWPVANKNTAALLHTFNLLASQNSEYSTFDKADFRGLLGNGIMIFGATSVAEWSGKEDISVAVRQNLKGSLLADGFDLATANMAGMIAVAHDDVLSMIPMEYIDYAFNSLGRALGNEGITLHNGIYEGAREGIRVFTIVSGMKRPEERISEIERLGR